MAAPTALLPQLLNGRLRTTGRMMGIALAVLALTPEMKFRVRSAEAAFSGGADLQILFELALWGAFGGWALLQVVRGVSDGKYRFSRLGPGVTIMLIFWVLATMTGGLALSIRSLVRAFQLTMLVTSLLLLFWESQRDRAFFVDTWVWFRRVFVGIVLVSMASSAFLNILFDVWPVHIDVDGFARYRFFFVHPISVGGMSGVALVLLLGMLIGRQDLPQKQWMLSGMWVGAAVLFAGIVGTRSRGSLAGALAAVGILVLLSKQRRIKVLAFAGGFSVLFGIIGYAFTAAGAEALNRLLTRGQTVEQLASLSQRTDLFAIAGELFRDRPMFGYGYFMPGPIFSTYFEWAGHGHNIFVEMAVAMGAAGLVVLVALMIVPLVGAIRAHNAATPSPMRVFFPEMIGIYVLMQAMGVIGPGISGSVAYEATGFLMFALFADLYRSDTRYAGIRRMAGSWRSQQADIQGDVMDRELKALIERESTAMATENGNLHDEVPVPSEPAIAAEPQTPFPDDLTLIRGIGPAVELALHRAGITSFAHIAQKTPEQLTAVLRHSGLRWLRIKPTKWPEEARAAMLARNARDITDSQS